MRRRVTRLVTVVLAWTPLAGIAAPPLPVEPNFATTVSPAGCSADPTNPYESAQYAQEGWGAGLTRYPGQCQRLEFAYGPLTVKPGQNDVLLNPVTIQKPAYDGYMVHFRPDLVFADGTVPGIDVVHLHHAVWLDLLSPYTGGTETPFAATGEEKTIMDVPVGLGMPVSGSDTWQLLYMIHNLTPNPEVVYLTYEVDFVSAAGGATLGLRPVYPVWLDVRPSAYPVFNVQRQYANPDPLTGRPSCTWPRQECAAYDPWLQQIAGQGLPGNGSGTLSRLPARGQSDGRISNFQGGTLVWIAGHVHPGGLHDDVELQRGTGRTTIFTSEAQYWSWTDPATVGGPPDSWDMSMTAEMLPHWGCGSCPRTSSGSTPPMTTHFSRPTRTWASRSRCWRRTTRTAPRARPA
ncbi:MAG: hypothetical protein ACYDAY_07745 [Candidatus Dormibacteria bacterium]